MRDQDLLHRNVHLLDAELKMRLGVRPDKLALLLVRNLKVAIAFQTGHNQCVTDLQRRRRYKKCSTKVEDD